MSNKLKLIVTSILLLVSSAVARAEDPEANQYPIQHPVISSHAHHVTGSWSFLANRRLNWEERANSDPS
jgi:methionine-rich copper-binding protein CopC